MEITTRAEARERGASHYYTGIPCLNGHMSPRNTHSKTCLACHRERRTKLREEHPERVKAAKAASYRRHREKVIAKVAAYQAANRDKIRARQKTFREANKDILAARMAAWSKQNRSLLRIHERRRRDRKRGAVGRHTLAEIRQLERAQELRCANLRCSADISTGYHVDHVLPLVLGGSDSIGNIQLLCPTCNLSKGDLHPDEWRRRIE